jgi:tetratricopeptide (TPR) repeat protein
MDRSMNSRVRTAANLGVLITALLAGSETTAAAQPDIFFQRLGDLTTALEGTSGHEGPRIGEALDQMSRALAEWDRRIRDVEARLAVESKARAREAVDARIMLARLYAQRGRIDDARREIERAIGLDPRRADAHLLRGLMLEASGTPGAALDAFANARALDTSDPIGAYYLLRSSTRVSKTVDVQSARASFDAVYRRLLTQKTRPTAAPFPQIDFPVQTATDQVLVPLAAYAQPYARIARREYDQAITEFRTAAAADPMLGDPATRQASEAHRVRGLAYWAAFDDRKSVEEFELAIESNPRDERSRLALFQILRMAGRDAEAADTMQQALRALPDSVRAHWWLGVTYERLNRFVDARQEFERAAEGAVAGRSAAFAAIGRLAAREADLDAAAIAFARAVSTNPNDAAAHKYLASTFLQQDRFDDALVEWVAALLIDPLDPDAHAGIGQLFLNMGRSGDAVAALRRAVELSPGHTEARYALAVALTRVGNTKEAALEFARVEAEQRQALAERRRKMALDVSKEEESLKRSDPPGAP